MENMDDFEEKYQTFIDGCRWRGTEEPTRDQYMDYLKYRHLLNGGEIPAYNQEDLEQVILREQIIENAFFPNGRWG